MPSAWWSGEKSTGGWVSGVGITLDCVIWGRLLLWGDFWAELHDLKKKQTVRKVGTSIPVRGKQVRGMSFVCSGRVRRPVGLRCGEWRGKRQEVRSDREAGPSFWRVVKEKLSRRGIPGIIPDMILEGTVNKPQAYRGILQTGHENFSVPPPYPNYNSSHIEAQWYSTWEELIHKKLAWTITLFKIEK